MARQKLVLIDGHALAYRAFHALPVSMATSKGELTNAVYGFASMLLNVLRDVKPEYVAVAFDTGRTFRSEMFPEYKATRAKMPDELRTQITRIQELVAAMNVPVLTQEGYEADDILGTVARQAVDKGLDVMIVTGDADILQLVNDHVQVLTSLRRFSDTKIFDRAGVRERYSLEPQQIIDYKGLAGDTSDNIPGVRGIGEKTATELLQQYGTIDGIYKHLEEITGKRARTALEGHEEDARLSRDLATIRTDVPVPFDLEACRTSDYDRDKVRDLFRELEFRSLLERLPESERAGRPRQMALFAGEEEEAPAPPAGQYTTVLDRAALEALANKLTDAGRFAFDVETTSTDPHSTDLVGISVATEAGSGYYVPVGHTPMALSLSGHGQLDGALVKEILGPVLADPKTKKCAHNGKFDQAVLHAAGIPVEGLYFDTMIGEWLLDPGSRSLGLKNLAFVRLGVEMTEITKLIGSGKTQISMADVPVTQVAPYAAADADMTLRLMPLLEKDLHDKALWKLFAEVEMPLVPVLMDMEAAGVALDTELLARMSREITTRLAELERQVFDAVGHSFNLNSTQQLSDALFGKLGLSNAGRRKTASGAYSTAVDTLEALRGQHPVIELILEQRQLAKLKSTYLDALPQMVNPRTGRLHTSYNQTGTVTGRLSSSDPNLQNIPIRSELGRKVRSAFVAPRGYKLVAADYSQVELRILAHLSQDPAMLAAFARGEDIHASTASSVYKVPLSDVTKDMRAVAKTANFAVTYGVTDYGLSQSTGLSQEDAAKFIADYYRSYPKVREYLDATKRLAASRGWVETVLGRRRYFPELHPGAMIHAGVRSSAERMAINMPVQGSAADIIKIAMIRLHRKLKDLHLHTRLILQVHDELMLEAPEAELDTAKSLIKEIMEGAWKLDAPLKVDVSSASNWGEMK